MTRSYWVIGFFTIVGIRCFSQGNTTNYPGALLQQYAKSKPDTGRVHLLIKLSSFYLLKPGEEKIDLDSAILVAQEAKLLSRSIKYKRGEEDADFLLGWIYVEGRDYPQVRRILNSVSDTNRIKIMYQLVNYKMYTSGASEQDFDTAAYYCQQILIQNERIRYETADQKTFAYNFLSRIYWQKGDYAQALAYGLKCIKLMEDGSATELIEEAYATVGRIYFEQGNMEQSISWYKKSIEKAHKSGRNASGLLKLVTRSYIKWNKPGEALVFLEKNINPNAAYSPGDESSIIESKGNCYFAMAQYDKAEQCYMKCLAIKNLTRVDQLVLYVPIAKFYIQTKQFDKARFYVDELSTIESKKVEPVFVQRDVELMHFQTDSAFENYTQAIAHLQLHKALNDSIFNDTKNKQLEELKVQYETDKKNKDIELLRKQGLLQASQLKHERLKFEFENEKKKHELEVLALESDKKENDLKLAKVDAQRKGQDIKLKEQNIQLLNKQDLLQKADLQKKRFFGNVLVGGTAMLLVLLGLVYNRYRNKQRTNKLLQVQQEEINQSNNELKQLNDKQQKLLTEKEWLVKEIHHRVKNNLQIVISLLNAQSEFLNNPSAIDAIRESRERMQAIAIIHQKLYQTENNTKINMRSYVNELVDSIKGGVTDTDRIHFQLNITDVNLDISQSVPLGLIMNEAITNAIKYAYAKNEKGSIQISLQRTGGQQLQLSVADQGKGLPDGIDAEHSNSLGLQLIKLFSEQLDGDLFFINNNGLEIMLNFKAAEFVSPISDRIIA